jgi:hypothetical protein
MVFAVNKVALGQVFLRVLRFSRRHHTTVVLHTHDHRGDEQQARWLPQFRDMVSPHGHEQGSGQIPSPHTCLVLLAEFVMAV